MNKKASRKLSIKKLNKKNLRKEDKENIKMNNECMLSKSNHISIDYNTQQMPNNLFSSDNTRDILESQVKR